MVLSIIQKKRYPQTEFQQTITLSKAYNIFGGNLLKTVANFDKNLIMSAFSVSTVLSMLLAGARGNTFSQIKKALALEDDIEVVKNGCRNALEKMNNNVDVTLKTANRY